MSIYKIDWKDSINRNLKAVVETLSEDIEFITSHQTEMLEMEADGRINVRIYKTKEIDGIMVRKGLKYPISLYGTIQEHEIAGDSEDVDRFWLLRNKIDSRIRNQQAGHLSGKTRNKDMWSGYQSEESYYTYGHSPTKASPDHEYGVTAFIRQILLTQPEEIRTNVDSICHLIRTHMHWNGVSSDENIRLRSFGQDYDVAGVKLVQVEVRQQYKPVLVG